jgi:hypothetical protein
VRSWFSYILWVEHIHLLGIRGSKDQIVSFNLLLRTFSLLIRLISFISYIRIAFAIYS